MAVNTNLSSTFQDNLLKFIEEEIKSEIAFAWDKEKEKIINKINIEKSKAIAGILLHVMKQVNISQMGSTIQIIIQDKNHENITQKR